MLDFGNVYPSVMNWVVIGLMAITFISAMKFLTAKWNIPGISDLVGSI